MAPSYRPPPQGPIPARAGQPRGEAMDGAPCGAYPRSRGATRKNRLGARIGWGLSPLARGNRTGCAARVYRWGPIPARAGQPLALDFFDGVPGAYPRSRGATPTMVTPITLSLGLSPLARGNRLASPPGFCLTGPIPARAGQPQSSEPLNTLKRAYPRSRGATSRVTRSLCRCLGLSPLARGNRTPARCARAASGPIPARAGQPSAGR